MISNNKTISLNGTDLTVEDLYNIGHNNYQVHITSETKTVINAGRKVIDDILASEKTVYGINTGFGLFSEVKIPHDQLKELQNNLIRSHSAGVGDPLSPENTRMLFALRINVLAKGYSGITLETVERAIKMLNSNCLPFVPEKGTVGASGDLAPLSHLALGLMGESKMYDFKNYKREDHINAPKFIDSMEMIKHHNLTPIELSAKEGLALINGTQFISSLGAEAIHRAKILVETANIATALSFECLNGLTDAYHPAIHQARPHSGQILVAEKLRALLHGGKYKSEINQRNIDQHQKKVQDPYTLRCVPQVHGIVYDTIEFVEKIMTTELNSGTDNPMVFSDPNINRTMSGGNFHGEYPAKVLDYLTIALNEISNISERRLERLVNVQLSEGLPAFLVKEGGLNSGFMIAHCTAAALCSENKTLVYPGSADTISTSGAKEDHVSMGGWSARKCLKLIKNVEYVLAIEFLANIQGLDFRVVDPNASESPRLKTTEPLEAVHALIRKYVPHMAKDKIFQPDIELVRNLIRNGDILNTVNAVLNK